MAADRATDRFAREVAALADRLVADGLHRPDGPPRVVLYGSSTIRLWPDPAVDIGRDDVVAVGFGGATLSDLSRHRDRLLRPLPRSAVILAAGANDLVGGDVPPDALVARIGDLVDGLRGDDPSLPIGILSMKPAPYHGERLDRMRAVNAALTARAARWDGVVVIDGFTPLLDARGEADPRFYGEDRRHFSRAGYAVWGRAIAAALPALIPRRPPAPG